MLMWDGIDRIRNNDIFSPALQSFTILRPLYKRQGVMGAYRNAWNIFLTACGLSCVEGGKSPDGTPSYRLKHWRFVIPVFLVVAISIIAYLLAIEIPQIRTEKGKTLVTTYLTITGNIVAATIIICASISSSSYASIKERFILYDGVIYIDYTSLFHSISKYAAFFFIVFVFSFITDIMAYVKDEDGSGGSLLKMISAFIFQFYNLVSILHFSVCLFWLRKSFGLINGDMQKHAEESVPSVKHEINQIFRHNVIHPDTDFFQLKVLDVQKVKCQGLERLRFLRSLYHVAFELSRDVNGVFATRNVISVGYNFVIGTIYVYSGISELVRRTRGDSDVTMLELVILFKWSFISFLSIYGLVWPSTSTCNEIMGAVVSYLVVLIQFRITMV